MKQFILPALLVLISIAGCKKDKDRNFPEENFLPDFHVKTGFSQVTTNFVNAGSYEYGLKFTPKVKGNITKILLKIPDNANNIRVTFWDAASKQVLKTEVIPTVTKDVEVIHEIAPLNVEAGRMYMISINSNDWYKRSRTGGTSITYPVTVGNITVEGYLWVGTSSQIFPTNVSNDYNAGDLSFIFQQTN